MTRRVSRVLAIKLPMTERAMGDHASPPDPRPRARGVRARMVVKAVIKMGRSVVLSRSVG